MARAPGRFGPQGVDRRRRSSQRRSVVWAALLAAALGLLGHALSTRHQPGCATYRPLAGRLLIAHAGGGLPDRIYPNNVEALDRSYAHGLRIFEMDFHQLPFGMIRSGHDWFDVADPRSAWMEDVLAWLRDHPDARLITDFKTDNPSGLRRLAAMAPDLRQRIIPFVYEEADYPAARALGFARPIVAVYAGRMPGWVAFANTHDVAAVALPYRRRAEAKGVHRPLLVHSLDRTGPYPAKAYQPDLSIAGIVSDCLVPATAGAAS